MTPRHAGGIFLEIRPGMGIPRKMYPMMDTAGKAQPHPYSLVQAAGTTSKNLDTCMSLQLTDLNKCSYRIKKIQNVRNEYKEVIYIR